MYLFAYVKFVQDKLKTGRKEYINYRFYDERENRVVPDFRKHKEIPMYLTEAEYRTYKIENGSSTLKFGVRFTWKDIKYLIVNSESNIGDVRQILKKENIDIPICIFTKAQVIIGVEHNKEVLMPVYNINSNDVLASIHKIERLSEEIKNRIQKREIEE